MEMYSLQFVLLLMISLLIYYTIGKKYQWICLLITSMVFYLWSGSGNIVYILLTGFTTWLGATYLSLLSDKYREIKKDKNITSEEKKRIKHKIYSIRRIVMLVVLMLNFGILAYLKYWNNDMLSLGLVLPLGISFYTFQSIGYFLDVYNERYAYEKSFSKYMLFVSFFPQLLQGPINRYDKMREQFLAVHTINFEKIERACYRIGYGLLKKYAIANILAPIVAQVLDNEKGLDIPGAIIAIGILLYSVQQYADFSGGIDMVLGVAMLFDIEMAQNFRQPYFATSLADFWRRWHISLGNWMRDYLFYPFALTKPIKKLGKWANSCMGKHLGRVLPAMLGNILVFFVVGLWHGAQIHYIAWGLYNGVIIAFSDLLEPVYRKLSEQLCINTKSKAFYIFQIVRTFLVVNIGWCFDRIEDMKYCLECIYKLVFKWELIRVFPLTVWFDESVSRISLLLAMVATAFVFAVSVLQEKKIDVYDYLHKKPIVLRWTIYYATIFLVLVSFFSIPDAVGFMYANF